MKSQDSFLNTLVFPTVHVKKLTISTKNTTIQDIQDIIAHNYI